MLQIFLIMLLYVCDFPPPLPYYYQFTHNWRNKWFNPSFIIFNLGIYVQFTLESCWESSEYFLMIYFIPTIKEV